MRPDARKSIIRAERRDSQIEGYLLARPVPVTIWGDGSVVWVRNEELNILCNGLNEEEASLRFLSVLIHKKLSCLEYSRNGYEGQGVNEGYCAKIKEYF